MALRVTTLLVTVLDGTATHSSWTITDRLLHIGQKKKNSKCCAKLPVEWSGNTGFYQSARKQTFPGRRKSYVCQQIEGSGMKLSVHKVQSLFRDSIE